MIFVRGLHFFLKENHTDILRRYNIYRKESYYALLVIVYFTQYLREGYCSIQWILFNVYRKEYALAITWAEAALSLLTGGAEVRSHNYCFITIQRYYISQHNKVRWEGGLITDIRSFLRRVRAEHNTAWVSPQVLKSKKFFLQPSTYFQKSKNNVVTIKPMQ